MSQSAVRLIVEPWRLGKTRFHSTMSAHFEPEDRLSILRAGDQFRTWKSLDDQRVCILCERKFSGHNVEIMRCGDGSYELHCPTEECNSGPHQWVYSGTPLISDIIEPDWWRAAGKDRRRTRTKPAPRAMSR
jgi:hypothetical protein